MNEELSFIEVRAEIPNKIEKPKSLSRVSETLRSFLPRSNRTKEGVTSTSSEKVKINPNSRVGTMDSNPKLKERRSKSGHPSGGSDSVHWILPPEQYSPEVVDGRTRIPPSYDSTENEENLQVPKIRKSKGKSRKLQKRSSVDRTKSKSSKPRVRIAKTQEEIFEERLSAELEKCGHIYETKYGKAREKFAGQISKLRQENDNLILKVSKLEEVVQYWKGMCEQEENRAVVSAKLKSSTRENKNLNEDLEVLKTVIRRLNKEISFYQEKLRLRYQSSPHRIPIFSSSNSDSNADDDTNEFDEPKKILLPLLRAYDEVIEEKQDIIKDNEVKMERFKLKCLEIVQENDKLHKVIAENKGKGSVSLEEWQFLYDNAVLVLEENDLLHDKISVLHKKNTLIQEAHEKKVSKLKLRIGFLEDEKTRLVGYNKDLEKQSTSFTEQIKKMAGIIQLRIPKEEHEASVQECRQWFEDLKRRYADERTVLTEKLSTLTTEKERLVNDLTKSEAEITKLQTNTTKMEESISAHNEQMKELQKKLSDATKSHDLTSCTINEMMDLVRTAFSEREALEVSYNEQRKLNEQMMSLRTRESELVAELHKKIEVMAEVHKEEIQEHLNRIQNLEDVLQTIGERQQMDVSQLKDLINEKTCHIEKLQTEKRQLIDDLETVWRATTKDRGELGSISLMKLSHGLRS